MEATILKQILTDPENQPHQGIIEDYYMDCRNSGCEWSGLYSQGVESKDSDNLLCPACGGITEPADREE